jgi:CheY-like chemotaxis protein
VRETRIGDILVEHGTATRELVETAAREARARKEQICSRLLALGVDETALAAALSEKLGFPGIDLSRSTIELDLLSLVPERVAEADLILPISSDGGRLHIAMAQPTEEKILAEFRFVTGREVSPWIAVTGALRATITAAYSAHERGEKLLAGPQATVRDAPFMALAAREAAEADVVALDPSPGDEGGAEELLPDGDVELLEGEEPEIAIEVEAPAPAGPRRILVVDDEPEIRTLVQAMLEKDGFVVELAVDGAEALAKAEELVPDLILLDAMLPKIHGFDVCRRIKNAPRTRKIPVIMMTAIYRGWRFAQDARETYGAEDYVEKPFRVDDLLRRIKDTLEATDGRELPPRGSADPALQKGKDALAAGRIKEAAAAFESATQADPWSLEAWFQLARALRADGDTFRAMTAFERALEIRSNHLASLRALAGIYEEKGFRRKAAGALERALAVAADAETKAAVKADLMRLLG